MQEKQKRTQLDRLLGVDISDAQFAAGVKKNLGLRHQEILLAVIGQRLKAAGAANGQAEAQFGRLRTILQEQYGQLGQALTRVEQIFYGWLNEMYVTPEDAWHMCHQYLQSHTPTAVAEAWRHNPELFGPLRPGGNQPLAALSNENLARLWQAMQTARHDKARLEQQGIGSV